MNEPNEFVVLFKVSVRYDGTSMVAPLIEDALRTFFAKASTAQASGQYRQKDFMVTWHAQGHGYNGYYDQ